MVMFRSAYYTVMVAALYLPAALILYRRVTVLCWPAPARRNEKNGKGADDVLAIRRDLLPNLLTILAPLIVGVVSVTVKPLLPNL